MTRDETTARPAAANILRDTANALKGEPKPLHEHSWRDLAEKYSELRAALSEAIRDSERLDELQAWTRGDTWICPPGEHGGLGTNWLLSREDVSRGDRHGNWNEEYEGPTLRAVIDAARAARAALPEETRHGTE